MKALMLSAALLAVLQVGRPAPDIAFADPRGKDVRVSAYRGQVVLVDFWATWCKPCQAAFPDVDALSREYASRGVTVLAVNVDTNRQAADSFLKAHPYKMTLLFDPTGGGLFAFGVSGMPTSFIIDRVGKVRYRHIGYGADVVKIYRREIDQLLSEQ